MCWHTIFPLLLCPLRLRRLVSITGSLPVSGKPPTFKTLQLEKEPLWTRMFLRACDAFTSHCLYRINPKAAEITSPPRSACYCTGEPPHGSSCSHETPTFLGLFLCCVFPLLSHSCFKEHCESNRIERKGGGMEFPLAAQW